MSARNNGGPAFPYRSDTMAGMTLRDYMATAAMAALFDSDAGHSPAECRMIATESYEMADAMLAERDKERQP